jgi:hypothetical protein
MISNESDDVPIVNRMKKQTNHKSRRKLLIDAARAGLAAALLPLSAFSNAEPQKSGLIIAENEKPGTTDWQLTFIKSEQYRSKLIEGYCSKTSVRSVLISTEWAIMGVKVAVLSKKWDHSL